MDPIAEQNRKIFHLLMEFFQDEGKVVSWLCTENPNFGSSPSRLIESGRGHKVLYFIEETFWNKSEKPLANKNGDDNNS